MTYQDWANINAWFFYVAITIWLILLFKLVYGIILKRSQTIKSSIKYLVHSLTIFFSFIVYTSFALVVNGPHGEERVKWVWHESIEWFIWALGIAILLALFNNIFQNRIEKIKNNNLTIILFVIDILLMCCGIFLGGKIALAD